MNFVEENLNELKKQILLNVTKCNNSIYDRQLIEKATTKLKVKCLGIVASSLESIESEHHREDMDFFAHFSENEYKDREYIIENLCDMAASENTLQNNNYRVCFNLVKMAKSAKTAECAYWVADSILSSYQYQVEDIKLIVHAKSDTIAIALRDCALSEKSLHSGYHSETMQLIFEAKSDDIAKCISAFACYSKIRANYKEFIDLAATIEIDAIAYAFTDMINGFSLFEADKYDLNNLHLLTKVKSKTEAIYLLGILYNLGSPFSRKERFGIAINFALMRQYDLEGIDISEVYNVSINDTSSIVPKRIK